jgi:hypothetical protein
MIKSCVFFGVRTELLNIIYLYESSGFKGFKSCSQLLLGIQIRYFSRVSLAEILYACKISFLQPEEKILRERHTAK